MGTLYDGIGAEYVIVSIAINSRGEGYDVDLAWTMSPALTTDVEPGIYARDNRYLIYYQEPTGTKDVLLFDASRGTNNLSNV